MSEKLFWNGFMVGFGVSILLTVALFLAYQAGYTHGENAVPRVRTEVRQ